MWKDFSDIQRFVFYASWSTHRIQSQLGHPSAWPQNWDIWGCADIPSGNQTCLAGKSSRNGGFKRRKIIDFYGPVSSTPWPWLPEGSPKVSVYLTSDISGLRFLGHFRTSHGIPMHEPEKSEKTEKTEASLWCVEPVSLGQKSSQWNTCSEAWTVEVTPWSEIM